LEDNPALMDEIEAKVREMSTQATLNNQDFDIEDEDDDEFDIRTLKTEDDGESEDI